MKWIWQTAASVSFLLGLTCAGDPPTATRVEGAAGATPKVNVTVLRADVLEGLKSPDGAVTGKPVTATVLEVTLAPGAASPPHRHPGSVSGYVVEGTFEFAVGDGPVRTLRAGDTFFEPTMVLHRVGRNPSADAETRLIVTMVHPSDAEQLVIPEPPSE